MTIFNKFAQLVIQNPKKNTCDLFNAFIKTLNTQEKDFALQNYMLIIKVGDAAINAKPIVQKLLK